PSGRGAGPLRSAGGALHAQPSPLDLRAGVHDDVQPGLAGLVRGGVVDHPQLHPDRVDLQPGLVLDRLVDHGTHVIGVDEAVHDLDVPVGDVRDPRVAGVAVDRLGRVVHGDDALVHLPLQPLGDAEGVPVGVVAPTQDVTGGGGGGT